MKTVAALLIVTAALAGCASTMLGSSPGQFVMSGPVNAIAPELSMRWQYGLKLNEDPQTLSQITFSCGTIPGSSFSVKGSDLERRNDGAWYVDGPVLRVSKESTPWLYERATTSAQCTASLIRVGQPASKVTAQVNFAADTKLATLLQLHMAHDFNSRARAKD